MKFFMIRSSTPYNINNHCKIIREKSLKQQFIYIAHVRNLFTMEVITKFWLVSLNFLEAKIQGEMLKVKPDKKYLECCKFTLTFLGGSSGPC